jgi:hypothetical protein
MAELYFKFNAIRDTFLVLSLISFTYLPRESIIITASPTLTSKANPALADTPPHLSRLHIQTSPMALVVSTTPTMSTPLPPQLPPPLLLPLRLHPRLLQQINHTVPPLDHSHLLPLLRVLRRRTLLVLEEMHDLPSSSATHSQHTSPSKTGEQLTALIPFLPNP